MKASSANAIRVGVVGVGNMGALHAEVLASGKIRGACLAAVCDIAPEKCVRYSGIPSFSCIEALIAARVADAVIIATPHDSHTPCGIAALRAGLHVLVEKPISVHKADALRLIRAWEESGKNADARPVFAAMFNQRTDPCYKKLRALVRAGELGEIRRIQWTVTDWFRTHAYYASSEWRATWSGEGGGLLLNQCLHQLDLFQWIFGMPESVHAFCFFGRYHEIEVEDDVTAFMQFEDGATAVLITSTGEAPGSNRLEIAAERGRVIVEARNFLFQRNEVPMSEFSRKATGGFTKPDIWEIRIPIEGTGGQHAEVIQNFVDVIRGRGELIAPAHEGIHSVELANAMLLSAFTNSKIALPMDAEFYENELRTRIRNSTFVKQTANLPLDDFARSF